MDIHVLNFPKITGCQGARVLRCQGASRRISRLELQKITIFLSLFFIFSPWSVSPLTTNFPPWSVSSPPTNSVVPVSDHTHRGGEIQLQGLRGPGGKYQWHSTIMHKMHSTIQLEKWNLRYGSKMKIYISEQSCSEFFLNLADCGF